MSLPPEPFDANAILADARATDGLSDFGDESFLEPLHALLSSLAGAPLNPLGAQLMRASVVWSLGSRLRAQYWFAQHPEILDERIEAPLVVVGMMRSGTTLLQRVLASDPRHYSALGWELRAPAPRPGAWPADPDPRIAGAEANAEQTRRFAPDLFAIHPTHPHEAEEEIVFLADAFLSHVPEASCDVGPYRTWLDEQDFTPAYEHLHRMLQLLQWQKRQRGEQRGRWVLKTPAHLGYLDNLLAIFPDAHVIHMHRNPLETIPSGASLNTTLWRMHGDEVDPARVGSQWIARMAFTNGRAMQTRNRLGDSSNRFTDVWFRDAVSNPLSQVERIYDDVGIELSDEARTAMARWLAQDAQTTRAPHRYAPEDFGLSAGQIREQFADYTARFVVPYEDRAATQPAAR